MKSPVIKLLSWRLCDEINFSRHMREEEAESTKGGLDSVCRSLSLETGLGASLWCMEGPEQGWQAGSERRCSQMVLMGAPWMLRRKERGVLMG